MKPVVKPIYSLSAYTVERRKGRFYVAPMGTEKWSKPYKTLTLACTAIARKLEQEWNARHQRRLEFYGKKEGEKS